MKKFHLLLATWFGLGLSPKAPGTMGSIGTLPFIWLLSYGLANIPALHIGNVVCNILFLISILVFFLAIPSVNFIIRDRQCEDPQLVVIDEVAGQTLAFAFIPLASIHEHFWILPAGLALFRIFDIKKPFGIHRLESLPRAWGVMADDMLGGLYAGIVLAIIAHFV